MSDFFYSISFICSNLQRLLNIDKSLFILDEKWTTEHQQPNDRMRHSLTHSLTMPEKRVTANGERMLLVMMNLIQINYVSLKGTNDRTNDALENHVMVSFARRGRLKMNGNMELFNAALMWALKLTNFTLFVACIPQSLEFILIASSDFLTFFYRRVSAVSLQLETCQFFHSFSCLTHHNSCHIQFLINKDKFMINQNSYNDLINDDETSLKFEIQNSIHLDVDFA